MNYDKLITRIAKAIHKEEQGQHGQAWKDEGKGVQNAFRDEAVVALKTLAGILDENICCDITTDLLFFLAGQGGPNYVELHKR